MPGPGDNADVFNNGTVNVTDTESSNDFNAGGIDATTNVAGDGTINLYTDGSSGTFSAGSGGGWIRLGTSTGTTGTLNMGGGTVTLGNANNAGGQFNVGEAPGATGLFNLTGGTFTATDNHMAIATGGANSVGTVNINTAGTFNSTGEIWIGNNAGSVGTLNLDTGGTINAHNWFSVGRANGSGTLNMTGGTLVDDAANNAGSHFDIAGGGGTVTSVGVVNQSGGTVTTTNSIYMGENMALGGSATYNLSGNTSVLNANGGIILGVTSTGGFALFNANGGTLNTTGFTAGVGAATKTINLNGTQINALAASATFLGGAGVVNNVQAGGALINTNTFAITIASNLRHDPTVGAPAIDGGLTQTGTGNLTLGGNNTYTGPTSIASTLTFTNTGNQTLAGAITGAGSIVQNGTGNTTLAGANTYAGTTTVSAGAVAALTPGSLPGYNAPGKVTVAAGSTLSFGYGGANSFTSAQVDTARTDGNIAFAAGSFFGLDATQATGTATYASTITDTTAGALGVSVTGTGTVALTAANTYTGGTRLRGGFLNFANNNNLGAATGAITFNGGSLQYATGNTYDITSSGRTVTITAGGGGIDTNGNNVAFATPFATGSTGALNKYGAGDLALNATNTTLSNLFVHGGSVTTNVNQTFTSYSSVGVFSGDNGTLTVGNGSTFIGANDFNVTDLTGSTGAVTVGAGAALRINTLFVGKGSGNTNGAGTVGTFTQTGGLVAEANSGGDWRIGGGNGGAQTTSSAMGIYNISGGTLDTGNSNLQVGAYGIGTLLQTGGVVNSNSFTDAGRFANSNGTITVNGGVFNQTAGTGTLMSTAATPVLLAGGTGTKFFIGEDGTGTLNIGGTGVVNVLGGLVMGLTGTGNGLVNLNTGGTLSTVYISPTVAAGGLVEAGQSTFNFNGGTLASRAGANSAPATFFQGITIAEVSGDSAIPNSGAVIDTTAVGVTIAQPLLSNPTGATGFDGGLAKVGINTLTLTGGNSYSGPTVVSAGTLALNGPTGTIGLAADPVNGFPASPAGMLTVASVATVTGTGTFNLGASNVLINGTLAAGATAGNGDIGTLTFNSTGTLTLANTSTTTFDIASGTSRDLFVGTGLNLVLSAGDTLTLRGTVDPASTYTIFSGLATETGTYTTVTGTPANSTPVFTFVNGNYNLSFAAVPEPSTWAMGVFGLGLGAVLLRRRRAA